MSKNDSVTEDEVPPLEEVPEIMERLRLESKFKSDFDYSSKSPRTITRGENNKNQEFGGLRRGFLSSVNQKSKANCKKTEKNSAKISQNINEDIPLVRYQPSKSSLVLDDVQEALKKDDPMAHTKDVFSSKILSHPKISKILSDPSWIGILEEFQTDPQTAMEKYSSNKEVRDTMLELCSLLGDSFLHMLPSTKSEEDLLAQKLMEDPLLKDALTDPYIVTMMDHAKAGRNDKVHECLQKADTHHKAKIQMLIDYGLFKFVS